MSRRTLILGLLVGLLATPTSAVADSHHYFADPGYTTHVPLPASNGYEASLWAGYRRSVGVKVRKGGVTTEYRTRGASCSSQAGCSPAVR
ncbi:MAG: hypothetical protein QOF06_107 [Solirubrobacterales bacterium]|nr:hypothetical protein [Solirubrobacterales bacterium]